MSGQRRIFNCKNILIIIVASIILGMMVSIVPWIQPNGGLWADIPWANLPAYSVQEIPGLDGEIHIVRDHWGVPHIFASTDPDLYFGCGYAHAQDRLFQLDLYRRIAQGKLSELFGPENLEFDQFNRQLGLTQAAEDSLAILDPIVLELLESYTAGINHYMATIGTKIPVEIRVLGYFPVPWNVTDTLSIERYLAWILSASNAFQDLQMAKLIDTYGFQSVFTDLFPEIQYNDQFTVTPSTPQTKLAEAANQVAFNLQKLQEQSPISSSALWGSNSWVINGSLSDTGAPFLCSDPHLSLTTPPVWYEVHLIGPTHNVQGITYAGIPFVYQGHNADIAWGWTGMLSDVSDFYYYTWHPSQPNQYWWQGSWRTIEQRNVTIWARVDSSFAPVEKVFNYTIHGPLFEEPNGRFALKWTGANGSKTTEALYKLAKATDYTAFLLALEDIECPNLNFLYADTSGNIAYHAAAAQPIRGPGSGPSPLNGSSGSEEWMGFIPFAQLPQSYNPSTGFLVVANNRPVNATYPYYLGYNFAPPHRANRISDLLNASTSHSMTDMQFIQQDALSLNALAIKDIIASVVLAEVSVSENPTMHAAASELLDWDGGTSPDSIGATIWSNFVLTYMNETFFDEYFVADTPEGPYPSITVLENFTQINYDLWFDNVIVTGTQTRDDIILLSFEATVEFLAENLGPDVVTWEYNRIHVLWIQHHMPSTFPYLNAPRFPIAGSEYTINYAPGYLVEFGASYRLIIDFSDFNNSLGVLPGGQRSNPYSNHYLDQLGLWVIGEYHPLPYPTNLAEMTQYESIFILRPE